MSVIGTKEGIYVYNDKMVFVKCHFYQKCMWCGKKYKEGDDVVDAMYLNDEGDYVWSGDSIHRGCDDERYDDAESRRRATAVETRAASGARPRETPQTSSGSAQCQRRSEVRFECHAFVSIAALAHLVRVQG